MNLVSGPNGQGKTNLLEAAFVLATGRSFRDARLDALPRRGSSGFGLGAEVGSGGGSHALSFRASSGQRRRELDGRPADLGETLAVHGCVLFALGRLSLFRGPSEERRRFLDRGLVALEPRLLAAVRGYGRTLRQKNALLRSQRNGSGGREARDLVPAFNRRLAAEGAILQGARADYAARLQAHLVTHPGLGALVPGGIPTLTYRPSGTVAGAAAGIETGLRGAMDARVEDELRRGHALVGPHRDDVEFAIGDLSLGRFGSSGQQRAALIALKLAKLFIHKEMHGEYPILLLDDVDSELDAERSERALDLLDGPFQAIVASARAAEWIPGRPVTQHLEVRGGILRALS